ncbi:tetratricopeptide repeat protein [Methylobacter sp.]|uniref:tetratricopeptide repeat protein n=1 Tax=Methylobacter sp. TaxID=2051955 RepID=UPI001220E652|nr:tetratricopeptide repeat protein [Methylobacter sp.]TAK60994.1 MAG: tetratricopeptide repeat protein [Methylobacter sp.]
MLKPAVISLVLLFLAAPAVAEEEPTMHQVYLAAEAGKFNEAQSMMDKVLRAHPNSAKAHFVEAELLAKQGLLSNAGAELNTAERLQPGLPFAKPEAVKNLKSRISSPSTPSNGAVQPNVAAPQSLPFSVSDWMPWILLILGIGLVVLLIGYMSRRNSNVIPANSYGGNAPGSNIATPGMNGAGPAIGQPAAGGMGSGIMGSLATGAALGAGVVAGEALMHHFIDGDKDNVIHEPPHHDPSPWSTPGSISENNDMGGTDFGIADASSWDDDGASGGDDWT